MPSHSSGSIGTRSQISRARQAWHGWRLSRPFWGGLMVMVAGAEILVVRLSLLGLFPSARPQVAAAGLAVAIALLLCGLLLWFHPVQRSVYATVAVLLAILALLTAHLGGYLLGSLLGAIGGAVAFAWVPALPQELRSRHGKPARADGQAPALTLIIGESESGSVSAKILWSPEAETGISCWRPAAVSFPPDPACRREPTA